LKAEFNLLAGREELNSRLRALRDSDGWKRTAAHNGQLARIATEALGLPVLIIDTCYDRNDPEKCDVGITECDALVAQTSSVLVASRSAGGRCPCCRRTMSSSPASAS
jgi:L-lactate dehydrogenase complex protein LldG